MSATPTCLNLGCGGRSHPGWVNVDVAARGPGVVRHDLSRGIPLGDGSCDVVYSAAVLEHLRRPDAAALIGECLRVLKPGGALRVGVPDLERICRLYLDRLERALAGDGAAAADYDWIVLELLDQAVRERSGGAMAEYLQRQPLPNETFVLERIGEEGRGLLAALRAGARASAPARARGAVRGLARAARRLLLRLALGARGQRALDIGRFRLGGEAHQWMYDRFSLSRLLEAAGFADVRVCDAATSRIAGWERYRLDTLPDGRAVKPDLIFVEATKPEGPAR